MAKVIDRKQHYATIANTCYTANILYLILHVVYLVLFIVTKLWILVYVTAAVIAIYIGFFFLIKKRKYYLYALCCGNEFFAYIITTTLMVGFDTGFHFYLIGLCIVSFFTSYFSIKKDIKGSVFWVGLSLAIYLTLYFVTRFNPPYYAIDRWLEITLFTIHAITVFVFVAAYMVTFLKYALSLENKVINESRTDELTQINNRYALFDYFEEEKEKYNKVLALFDIDDFKNINDKHGHVTGDYVLKEVARITTEKLNDCFVCRYGGEEFVIVLSGNKETILEKLEDLRKELAKQTYEFEGEKINLTVTIGAAYFPKEETLEKWIELADEKMYSGKNSGKNKAVF